LKAYRFLGEGKNAASLKQIRAALSFACRHWDLKNPFAKIEHLIAKLTASLAAKILLRHRVSAISRSGKSYLVHTRGQRYPFDAVVLAMPYNHLSRLECHDGERPREKQRWPQY
jgi:monoamine oxidase